MNIVELFIIVCTLILVILNATTYPTDVDECSLYAPCKNGGTCVDSPGSYACRCPVGWTGDNCTVGKYHVMYVL